MIRYEVVLEVPAARAAEVAEYMRDVHIPEIFATGCFRDIRFERSAAGRFRTSYVAARRADLETYLEHHAPGLRDAFLARFPDGIGIARDTWTELAVWE
jgi:hypothetical protein